MNQWDSVGKFVRNGSIISETILIGLWVAYKPLITRHGDSGVYFYKSDFIFLKRRISSKFVLWHFSCTFLVSWGPSFHLSHLCMSWRCPFRFSPCLYVVIYYPEVGTWENAWPGVDNVSRPSRCQWEVQVLITFETMAIISRLKCLRGNTRITFDFKKQMQTTF